MMPCTAARSLQGAIAIAAVLLAMWEPWTIKRLHSVKRRLHCL